MLVVDDGPNLREVHAATLEAAGYAVVPAASMASRRHDLAAGSQSRPHFEEAKAAVEQVRLEQGAEPARRRRPGASAGT